MMSRAERGRRFRISRAGWAIWWAFALFLVLELGLQLRSQLRFGQSIFNAAVHEPMYRVDAARGLTLLTPGKRHEGSQALIVSNSLGLRSPEIPLEKRPDELRVAIVGASSVMGAYSKTNDHTLAAFLERDLRDRLQGRTVHVINAGIAGASLSGQRNMLHHIAPLKPDLVVFYPGFNDWSDYCRRSPSMAQRPRIEPVRAPGFLMSIDLLLKNTVFLRSTGPSTNAPLEPSRVDTTKFEQDVADLLATSEALGMSAVMATVARSYGPTQPLPEQQQLAATALYYNPCFSLEGLHRLHDRHNEILRQAAQRSGVPIVDLARLMPGGSRYFADASHFTEEGERLAAELLLTSIWADAAPQRNRTGS